MQRFATLFLFVTLGCSGAHTLDTDAGSPAADGSAVPDAGTSAHACRLPSPAPTPVFAGEPCYCDGPFVVRGSLAYRQSYQLEVVDVSTPGAPHLVTSLTSSALFANDIGIVGDVLFSAGGAVERFDLTDPRAPVSLGALDVGGQADAMATGNDRIVLGITHDDQTRAVVVLDATDPRAPRLGTPLALGTWGVSAILLEGHTAFAIAMDSSSSTLTTRILAIDVSDPSAPRLVDMLDASVSWAASLALHDTRLFVAGIGDGVRAIDVSTPSAMRDLGLVLPVVDGAQSVDVSGDLLVVGGSGMRLYDLSSPSLSLVGQTEPTSDSPHAMVTGDQLLGSGGNALFSIPLRCD